MIGGKETSGGASEGRGSHGSFEPTSGAGGVKENGSGSIGFSIGIIGGGRNKLGDCGNGNIGMTDGAGVNSSGGLNMGTSGGAGGKSG